MWKFTVLLVVALISQQFALAQVMRGKVTMADGSPPQQRVIIERVCGGGTMIQDALTGKQGEYFWRVPTGSLSGTGHKNRLRVDVQCFLRARLKELESDGI